MSLVEPRSAGVDIEPGVKEPWNLAGTNRLESLSWPAEELVCGAGVDVTRSIARDSRGRALEGFRTKYPQEDARYGLIYEPSGRLGAVDVDSDGTADIFYAYDHLSRRLEKRSGTETRNFTYLGDSLLFEGDVNAEHQEYIYLQGRPIALVTSSDANPATSTEVFRLATDHLATPMRAFADDGTVVWAADYEAFGSVVEYAPRSRNAPQISVSLRFPGQVFDAETGLHYNGHRYYSPQTGSYIVEEPLVRSAPGWRQPGYAYALSNPVRLSDRNGLFVEGALAGTLATLEAAAAFTGASATPIVAAIVAGGGIGVVIGLGINEVLGDQIQGALDFNQSVVDTIANELAGTPPLVGSGIDTAASGGGPPDRGGRPDPLANVLRFPGGSGGDGSGGGSDGPCDPTDDDPCSRDRVFRDAKTGNFICEYTCQTGRAGLEGRVVIESVTRCKRNETFSELRGPGRKVVKSDFIR